jgi:hypothetical protein
MAVLCPVGTVLRWRFCGGCPLVTLLWQLSCGGCSVAVSCRCCPVVAEMLWLLWYCAQLSNVLSEGRAGEGGDE